MSVDDPSDAESSTEHDTGGGDVDARTTYARPREQVPSLLPR